MTYDRDKGEKALREGNGGDGKAIYYQKWRKDRHVSDLLKLLKILEDQKDYNYALNIINTLDKNEFRRENIALYSSLLLRRMGKYNEARNILKIALECNDIKDNLLLELARNFSASQQFEKAIGILEGLKGSNFNSFSIWFNLGVAYSNVNKIDNGLKAFTEANKINPYDEAAAANMIILLKETKQLDKAREAIDCLPAEINRKRSEILGAEAIVLMAEQKFEEAAIIFKSLCEKSPLETTNWLNYTACIRANKVTVDPYLIQRTALTINPNDSSLQHALLQSLCELGKQEQARLLISKIKTNDFIKKDLHLFNILFLSTSHQLLPADKLKNLVDKWEKQKLNEYTKEVYRDYIHEEYTNSKRKIKVGYLSSDYCNHPVARFIQPILENHDGSIIETWCIHTGPYWDNITEKIKSASDHWLDLSKFDDVKASRIIADQKLDILVELGGFTGNNRIGICLNKPAYIQMSYLGYPGPTYLRSVPWWIGDKYLFNGINERELKSHKLAYIEKGYMTFRRPLGCPPLKRIGEKNVRFGSLNHARKITVETISLWCSILKECIGSKLVLKSMSFRDLKEQEHIVNRFIKCGLHPSRLILVPYQDTFEDHLEAYNTIDIALDPIPYGGATTTAEALWMGVPVVCKKGNAMASNLAASIIASANCSDLIADDEKEYVAIAKKLFDEGIRTVEKRENLVKKINTSPLNDPRRVSKGLEKIYSRALLSEEGSFEL